MIDFNNLPKVHEPSKIEKDIYEWWESQGFFQPEKQRELGIVDEKGPRFCITLPPPNVTGVLHLGHAIVLTMEDLMTRYERMNQKEALFLPGSDHAGIATQNVVERELAKKNINRKELGRKKFIEEVWKWKEKCHTTIMEQSKRMGASCDWTRDRFTLDDDYALAVKTAFVTLYKKGLIYRGEYMVNWCPGRCESAISDLEAEPQEHESSLWYIKYPIINDDWKGPSAEWGSGEWAKRATEFIEVATTRPETLLGDTGVATTENHPIFKKFIGKTAVLPVNARELPIFSDPHVDAEFGTGALKITPAHDPNDYDIGMQHNLDFITVMDAKARMLPEYSGKYANMDRYECRKEIVKDLEKETLLTKIEPYTHAISHCQRCNSVIEPYISIQWFVKTQDLAKSAMEAVKNGDTIMIPPREQDRFFQWMENIRDWCISRQLWWGHQIPVWYCPNGHETCELEEPIKCSTCGEKTLVQDEDVLDTWFSSGLWPFATLGWPNIENKDYIRFFPNDMRETAYDILFFWVAREMMMSFGLTGQTPYQKVYFHGIIRDEKGKKISKSMENIDDYDPLNIIAKYGADPLRFTLISNIIPSKDLNLNPGALKSSKNFCNKIWQSANFIFSHINKVDKVPRINPDFPKSNLKLADQWILSQLNTLLKEVNKNFEEYDYLNAVRSIRSFYWDIFCDWYLEISKIRIYDENELDKEPPIAILLHVLDITLRLLHPSIPYITEALWQNLPKNFKEVPALIVANWPEANDIFIDVNVDESFELIKSLIHKIRSLRKDFNVKPGLKIPLIIQTGNNTKLIKDSIAEISVLSHIDQEQVQFDISDVPKHSARIVLKDLIAYLPLDEIVDIEKEIERITNQINKIQGQIEKSEKKLDGPFSQRAKPEVVNKERDNLEELKSRKQILEDQLKILKE